MIFKGTYDEKNWGVLKRRWEDLRAQLHGIVISASLAEFCNDPESINKAAPNFSPNRLQRL
ncbi:MAG: hypothetical protein GX070_01870 [Alcaligenaceae bacterium]|nr:hypothetical protein [Alcaligenaceae bacterium]